MSRDVGVIYILTNPSFPDYIKIGYADNIERRLEQLNRSECVPFAFRLYATYEVPTRLCDIKIHEIIDMLNPNLRAIENFNGKQRVREFYAMSKEDGYKLLKNIALSNGNLNKLHLYPDDTTNTKDFIKPTNKNKRRKTTFDPYQEVKIILNSGDDF